MTSDSGREIDALVAEHVMGAVWNNVPNYPGGACDILQFPGGHGILVERRCSDGRTIYPANLPAYSTDIAAAWEVVEKMEGADFDRFDGHLGPLHAMTAKEAALDICLAALKAKGVEP